MWKNFSKHLKNNGLCPIEEFLFQQLGMILHSICNMCLFPLVVFRSVGVGADDERGQSVSWCGPLWHYNISNAGPTNATATILLGFPVWFFIFYLPFICKGIISLRMKLSLDFWYLCYLLKCLFYWCPHLHVSNTYFKFRKSWIMVK